MNRVARFIVATMASRSGAVWIMPRARAGAEAAVKVAAAPAASRARRFMDVADMVSPSDASPRSSDGCLQAKLNTDDTGFLVFERDCDGARFHETVSGGCRSPRRPSPRGPRRR